MTLAQQDKSRLASLPLPRSGCCAGESGHIEIEIRVDGDGSFGKTFEAGIDHRNALAFVRKTKFVSSWDHVSWHNVNLTSG